MNHSDRKNPVTDMRPDAEFKRYSLTFLADQWEWDCELVADTLAQAKTAARNALETLIREEAPGLACVYLLEGGRRIGVWDWVERQPYWTAL
jgi:hypothetical protein